MTDVDKKELDKRVWKLFESVRGSIDDFGALLYLIVIHKMGLYKLAMDSTSYPRFPTSEKLSELEIVMLDHAQSTFGQTLENLRENFLKHFEQILDELNDVETEEIFEYVLARYSAMSGKAGFISAPIELVQTLIDILTPTTQSTIFNPFSGVGGFIKSLPGDVHFYGQEINRRAFTISLLRLKAAEKLMSGRIELTDSVMNWPDHRFDKIISFPPFNMKFNNYQKDITGHRDSSSFIMDKVIDSLSDKGRAVIVLPNSWLYSKQKKLQSQKEFLIKTNLLETVITFPANLLDNTGIPFSVIVIDKNPKNTESINFIDATELVDNKGRFRKKFIQKNELISAYRANYDTKYKRVIDQQEIRKNNNNLIASRYFIDQKVGIKLKDLIRPIKDKEFYRKGGSGRLVKISELKDGNEGPFINAKKIEVKDLKTSAYKIDQKALLIASTFKNLKPSILTSTDLNILIARNIRAFEVKNAEVDIEFLALELRKDYVKEQVEKFQSGNVPSIRTDDILRLRVGIPSLTEQRAIVKSYRELTAKIARLESDKEELLEGNKKAEFDQFTSLKHTLGRPRQNILDWSDNLLDFFATNKDSAKDLSKKFESSYGFGLTDVFSELKNDISQISNILEKGEEALNVEKYELSVLSLKEVIKFTNNLSSGNTNYRLEKQILIADQLKNRGILANKVLLRTLLDDILTNANKYAFESHQEQNKVQITLRDDADKLFLIIRDNGVGFPRNFTKEKFIQKFKTSNADKGSGLGGFDIHQVAKRFNNPDWKLNLDEDPIFKVEFVFEFEIQPL